MCATEAGGVRNVTPVIQQYSSLSEFIVVSKDGGLLVFKELGVPVRQDTRISSGSEATTYLRDLSPDVILCGRAINQNSMERLLNSSAQSLGIPTVTIIDEWYDYRANFADELGVTTWPDVVCCPDDQAKYEAVIEGLPRNILKITGSPALSSLFDQREKYKGSPPENLDALTQNSSRPIIVFISEVISDGLVTDYSQRDENVDRIGYDEDIVRSDILEALSEVFQFCTVLEKPHPQAAYKKTKAINDRNVNWQIAMGQDLHSLCWWADIVIGMRSMGLFEAAILGKATLSYQPNLKGRNRCTAVRKELIPCCRSIDSLKTWLKQCPQTQGDLFVGRPDYAHKGAAGAVYSVLEEISMSFANA